MVKECGVLLVKGDPQVRKALVSVSSSESYKVVSAASCDEAIFLYNKNPADVVLLDLCLRAEDGRDVLYARKERKADLPVVVASAGSDCLVHISPAGASGPLEKPFEISKLRHVLKQATVRQSRRRALASQFSVAAMLLMGACLPFATFAQSPNVTAPFQITGVRVQSGNAVETWQGGAASNQVQRETGLAGPWEGDGLRTTWTS